MLNVLSLFDGISCGMVALQRAGIPVGKYYASEIEPNAIRVSRKNFPEIIHLGDIVKWRDWWIPWDKIDLVIGGSPCQGLSNYKYSGEGVKGLEGEKAVCFIVSSMFCKR